MRSRLSMTIRPGEGRSEAPSTATERGRRSGARSIGRGAFGSSESALIGRPPRDAGSGAKSRGAAERGLDVLHPVSGRVPIEVERPLARSLAAAEPRVRRLRQRLQYVGVHSTVPLDDLARPSPSPALVDEAVYGLDVEAAHLWKPPLATDH